VSFRLGVYIGNLPFRAFFGFLIETGLFKTENKAKNIFK